MYKETDYSPSPTHKWAMDDRENHMNSHWVLKNVNHGTTKMDFEAMSEEHKAVFIRILAFFTKADTAVCNNYVTNLLPVFGDFSIRSMLLDYASREVVHVEAYAKLIEVLDVTDKELDDFFQQYKNIDEMKAKCSFLDSFSLTNTSSELDIAKNVLVFGALTEGLMLYSSFVLLAEPFKQCNGGLMNGVFQTIQWSRNDEMCFDKETEILTTHGWKLFKDLTVSDKVAQYDKLSKKISFVNPSKIIAKPFKGDMKSMVHGTSIDFCTTPDHTMLAYNTYTNKDVVSECKDLAPHSRIRFYTAGELFCENAVALTDMDRLMIVLQADGTVPKGDYRNGNLCGYRLCTFGFKRQRKIVRFEALLARLDIAFKKKHLSGGFVYYVQIPVTYALKKFEEWVDLSKVDHFWCKEFLEELSHWDSHIEKGENTNTWFRYDSAIPANADIVQAISTLAGHDSYRSVQEDKREERYKDIHRVTLKTHSTVPMPHGKHSLVDTFYDDMVYCVTVPSGFIVTRRNNRVLIAGNCHTASMATLFNKIRGTIPFHDYEALLKNLTDKALELEDDFIDYVYGDNTHFFTLCKQDVKDYMRHIASVRMKQFIGVGELLPNPLTATDDLFESGIADFFGTQVVDYSHNTVEMDMDDVDWECNDE